MLKQVLRITILSAVVLAVASPAWAGTINVMLDDPIFGTGGPNLYQIYPGASPTLLSWQGCGSPPVPSGEGVYGYTDCLAFANDTNTYLTTFEIMIPIPTALAGDSFDCALTGPLTLNNCSSIAPLVAGTTVTLPMSFGEADQGVPGATRSRRRDGGHRHAE